MKNRKIFIILLTVLIGLAGWWFWDSKSSKPEVSLKHASTAIAQSSSHSLSAAISDALYTSSQIKAGNAINAMLSRNPNAVIPMAELVAAGASKEDLTKGILDAENATPLALYGKVIDQFGAPVVGAKMRGNVLINVGIEDSGSQNYYTETDSNGLFNFTGLHGVSFGAEPQKEGYKYNEKASVNWTKDYKPDAANPIIFIMYKLQGAESMAHSKFGAWIPYDGTPVAVDLFSGKKSEGGDFKITLIRDPLQVKRGRDHFDWKVQIEITGGGLVETHDVYPYEAPETGYQSVFDLSESKDNPNWTQKLVTDFYVRTTKNTYGRIHIDLTTDSDRPEGTGFSIEAYMNPASGSRNLEFDGAKEIKSK